MSLERLLAAALFAAGLVHLLPLSGVLGAERLYALYGLRAETPDMLLLLRHRAVLFGILGTAFIAAAFLPTWRVPAAVAALASMLAFIALALLGEPVNAALRRVLWVDVALCLPLTVGLLGRLWR